MKYFLLTDTHFGWKNSSMTWWKSMSDFMRNQFIPHVKSMDEQVGIIHLGDLFETRSTINTFIANGVRSLVHELSELDNVEIMYFIGGNHDYYSPENNDHCSLDIVLNSIPKVVLVTHESRYIPEDKFVLLPWGHDLEDVLPSIKHIFTHTDLITGNPKLSRPVFSGHIHQPYIRGNCRNLGSCFPLTFADANHVRFYYVWDSETDSLEKFKNESSIRFWRIRGKEELDAFDFNRLGKNDYIELYIKQSDEVKCVDAIQRLRENWKDFWCISQPDEIYDVDELNFDLEHIIQTSIPDDLKEEYDKVVAKVKEKN